MTLFGGFVMTVWVAKRDMKAFVALKVWWPVLFGAGASMMGVFWRREGLLNKAVQEKDKLKAHSVRRQRVCPGGCFIYI